MLGTHANRDGSVNNPEKPIDQEQSPGTKEDSYVQWDGPTDPHNPFNWSLSKKWRVTLLACFMTFVVEVNGTAMTSAAEQINERFHVSDKDFPHSYWPVLSWNLGGAAAPLFGLPLMEKFGIRWTYLVRMVAARKASFTH